jgi:hypothetical protein
MISKMLAQVLLTHVYIQLHCVLLQTLHYV